MQPPESTSLNGRADARTLALLLLLAVFPYLNTLGNAFVYDDGIQVMENPYIRSWKYLPEIFGSNVWSFLGAAGVTNHYRPLMTLGYLICHQLFGLVPFGFHLVNVILHSGIVWLVFAVSTQLFRNRAIAFVAAALFALHPVHTESVAWVAGITDLQLAFFYLLTFLLFLHLGSAGANHRSRTRLGMAGSFVLALLSKEPAVTLPVVATLYEHFYREDREVTRLREKFGRYGILWGLALGYIVFRVWLLGALAPVLRRVLVSWPEAILSGFALVAQYVWKLLWPVELCAHYVFRKSDSLADLRVLAGVGTLALAGGFLVWSWRRNRTITLAVVWFFLTLAPALNARWMAANVFAERYLYLPSVGFCWLVAWLWWRAWDGSQVRPLARRGLVAALAALSLLYAARVVLRNRDWRDDLTLYTATLRISPDAYLIRTNLGAVHWNRGDRAAAFREWQAALPYNPDDVTLLNNIGLAYLHQKRFDDAEHSFRRAIAVRPGYADPYVNLGRMYEQLGRPEEARKEYAAAIRVAPLHTAARNRLGNLLLDADQFEEAEHQFRQSLTAAPTADAYVGLGMALAARGPSREVEEALQKGVSLDPYDWRAQQALGDLYAASSRFDEAERAYDAALSLNPTNESLRAKRAALADRTKRTPLSLPPN